VAIFCYSMHDRIRRADIIGAMNRDTHGAIFIRLFGPSAAPEWCHGSEPTEFWTRAVAAEIRYDAQVAERLMAALPHEMTLEQNVSLLCDHSEEFTRDGRVVQATIHPSKTGDWRNITARLLIATRAVTETRFRPTKTEGQSRYLYRRQYLTRLRERWAVDINRHLETNGYAARVDNRSLSAQGVDREPSIHMGLKAVAAERKGRRTPRGDRNREIADRNVRRLMV
jgi:hypothetical protein